MSAEPRQNRAPMSRHHLATAVWGASPAGSTYGNGAAPGTREFFENVLRLRSSHEMPWLAELVPFPSFRGRTVLELGCGAGYDAYEFCRHGATYAGIDITPENVDRTRRHLSYFGYAPDVREADAENIPFPAEHFDIVFSNGVLHHTPDITRSFCEAFRVLRHGGEFWVILYHKHSIFHWGSLYLVDHLLRLGFRRRDFAERLAMIEYTTSDERPLVNVYSRRAVRAMLVGAGFSVRDVWVRKLVAEDLPDVPVLRRLWRHVPQRMLDILGRRWGWYVIARGVKA